MMVIQEARPRDLPGILALREQTLARYRERGAPVLNPDHETILARTQQAIEQPFAWCGVALDGETVVGCLLLRLMECPLNRHKLVAVQEVFVTAPAARGLGLGVQLLAKRGPLRTGRRRSCWPIERMNPTPRGLHGAGTFH